MDNRVQSLTVLLVSDFEKSKRFYREKLGCEVTDWWVVRRDKLMLGCKLLQSGNVANPNGEGLWDIYAYADDFESLDTLYAEWKEKGVSFVKEPEVTENDWGLWKEFAIQDPDGYVIGVGTAKK